MSEILSPSEITRILGCELSFLEDFKEELKLVIGAALGNEALSILTDIAKMSEENEGIAEIPVNIKVICRQKHSDFKVTGTIDYERKFKHKAKLEELSINFNQPDLPFGKAPDMEEEGEYEKENPQANNEDIYNRAIDLIGDLEEPKLSTAILKEKLHISFKRAAVIVTMLEDRGVLGPEENGTHEVRDELLKSNKQKDLAEV